MKKLAFLPAVFLLTSGMAKCESHPENADKPYSHCKHILSDEEVLFDTRKAEVFWSLDGYTVKVSDINSKRQYTIKNSGSDWNCISLAEGKAP